MKKLKRIAVRKVSPDDWNYVVEFEDDSGSVNCLAADFEILDEMATAAMEQMDAVIEAAARLPANG